jgi:hypothetical protein
MYYHNSSPVIGKFCQLDIDRAALRYDARLKQFATAKN